MSTPLQSFHPFSRLAAEIRLKIWAEYNALTPPSIIPIYYMEGLPTSIRSITPPSCEEWPHIYYPPREIPTILHVNREARAFGLSVYGAGFLGSEGPNAEGIWWSPKATEDRNTNLLCEHESFIENLYGKRPRSEGFLYWDPAKDIFSFQAEDDWSEINKRSRLWVGTCKAKFPRWLTMSDFRMDFWSSNEERKHRFRKGNNDGAIWLEIEAIFVEVAGGDTLDQFDEWSTMDQKYEFYEDRKSHWEKSIRAWIGSQTEKVPEVQLLWHDNLVAEVEERLKRECSK